MQIDYKFLQKICDAMRDNDSYYIDTNTLYIALFGNYDTKAADKLTGHLYFLDDEGSIEKLCGASYCVDPKDEIALIRLTSKGYGQCSCAK